MAKRKEKRENYSDPVMLILDFFNWLGEFLVYDDLLDYGKLDRIHHWQIGELLRQTTQILGVAYVLQDVLSEIKKSRKVDPFKLVKEFKKKKLTIS